MNTPSHLPKSAGVLAEIIQAQIHCVQRLKSLLETEHQILDGDNLDDLSGVSSTKLKYSLELEALTERLRPHQPPNADGRLVISESTLSQTGLSEMWLQLTGLVQSCRDQNIRNGVLLDTRANQVRKSLVALQPEVTASYGRSAALPPQFGHRISGHA